MGTFLRIGLFAAIGLVLATAVPEASVEAAGNGTAVYNVKMTGAEEVDAAGKTGVGDPDGGGEVQVKLSKNNRRLCWDWKRLRRIVFPTTAAHIHFGEAGVKGPTVVDMQAPDASGGDGCASINQQLGAFIRAEPHKFYVNVHNAPFPDGAIRGQLAKAPDVEQTQLRTRLAGDASTDADGSGKVEVTLRLARNANNGQVCFRTSVKNIRLPATASHIHLGTDGSIVVDFEGGPGLNGKDERCVAASRSLIEALAETPTDYYVNVHNADFPSGAIKGTLDFKHKLP